MELVPVPLAKPLLVLYSNPRTVALAPLILVMLPPRVAPVVVMEVTVELVVTVGAVWRVFAPPAVVEPDFVPEEKVTSLVVRALTLSVTPPVGEAAISEVMKM